MTVNFKDFACQDFDHHLYKASRDGSKRPLIIFSVYPRQVSSELEAGFQPILISPTQASKE